MKTIKFYQVMKNLDRTEGRGPMIPADIGFTNQTSALAFVTSDYYAKEYGVQGTPGSEYDVKERTYFIYDSFDEWDQHSPDRVDERKRENALAKLTVEERSLLGL